MTATFLLHAAGFCVPVADSEMLNGIARTIFLDERVGVASAKRFALVPALALCLLICYYYVPFLHNRNDGGLLLLRISSPSSWGFSDVIVDWFVVKIRWEAILDDFDVRKGNLLALGMVAMAFCPLLAIESRDCWEIPRLPGRERNGKKVSAS
jgi:hypothetical protein